MKISSQLLREIEELRTKELYRSNNSTHMEERHLYIDDNGLRRRLAKMTFDPFEPHYVSKFDIEIDEVLQLIHDCLLDKYNMKQLGKWIPERKSLVLTFSVGKPIGHGFAKGTNTFHPYQMNDIAVVLGDPIRKGRLFSVITAYPIPDMEQRDVIDEDIVTYMENFKRQ